MNKKLVLSVLSTAVLASMASAAMAKPQAGFYVGGEAPKIYGATAFLDDFDAALDAVLDNLDTVVFVDNNSRAAKLMDALAADSLESVMKDATKADFAQVEYAIVGEEGTWNPETDPDLNVEAPGELKVESVSAIETTFVEVAFPALADAVEGATVEVKDSKGTVREVVAQDLAKGATKAQFDFVTAVKADELTGVWSVEGKEYSFDELKLVQDIVTASTGTVNEVKLFNLLNQAGIQNINENIIAKYAQEISTKSPVWFKDVQKNIDDVNKAETDDVAEAAAVKSVVDATNQIQLAAALQANFERVNAEWIAKYAEEVVAGQDEMLKLAGPANYFGVVTTGVSKADIQTAIDDVNDAAIAADDLIANTAAKQAAVTTLIQNWVKADDPATPNNTPKADAIKASEINRLGFVVAEATTENTLYNALVAYANATPDATLKASELNANLKKYYFDEMKEVGSGANTPDTKRADAVAGFTGASNAATYDYKTNIVTVADGKALGKALDDVGLAATAYNGAANATNKAAFTKALQQLADFTSHKTVDTEKFLISTIDDALLAEYATGLAAIDNGDDVDTVQQAVKTVNDQKGLNTAVQVIANPASTTAQVRDALVELALEDSNATTDAFVEASTQVKLEVAQFIVDNRSKLAQGNALTPSTITADGNASYAANALGKAIADHAAKVAEFNAIGDLGDVATTTASTKDALDTYAYAPYKELSAAQKLAVAEEINKLTKSDGATPPVITPLDFSGADAVTTLKAANEIIDAAIAAIQ